MAVGRPTKYENVMSQANFELVRYWTIKGYTEEEIAEKLGIAYSTLKEWKNKYEDFSAALKAEKGSADDLVENSLYKKALSGDVTACIFWLKNRRRKEWRDKPEDEGNKDNSIFELAKAIREVGTK